jgi:hypothetical protein
MKGMQLYSQRQQKPRWKNPNTYNVATQTKVVASGLGVREGIGLKWSCRFRLYGLDV